MSYWKDNTDFWNNLKLSKYKPSLYNSNSNIDKKIDKTIINDIYNKYVCYEENNKVTNWLKNESLNYIFNEINKPKTFTNNEKITSIYPEYWLNKNSIYSDDNSNNTYANDNIVKVNSVWWYSKVRDNSQWPCESFFCINIDFIMYEHNLFWSSENITVEYLLNRSNDHLSKFVSTSMIPAKMSTNLFEIWLKDLNLSDIFHMAIEVSTKPIPILRLEKQWAEDETELSSKNLLEKYYETHGLDYKRRNDVVLLNAKEQEKQSIINSQELTTQNANEKNAEYGEYIKNKEKGIRIIDKAIEKRVSYWVLDTFVEQYTELDKFTNSIYHYVENLNTIITKMREIPIDKG
jgi:hypothetical protein